MEAISILKELVFCVEWRMVRKIVISLITLMAIVQKIESKTAKNNDKLNLMKNKKVK